MTRAQSEGRSIFRTHRVQARRPICFLLDLPLGFGEETPSIVQRIRRQPIALSELGRLDGLPCIAHFLNRRGRHAADEQQRDDRDYSTEHLGFRFHPPEVRKRTRGPCKRQGGGFGRLARSALPFYTAPMKITLYHNPRCSKSRAALALLTDRGADIELVEYLKTPPSRTALAALLSKLDQPAIAMVRTDEPEFRPYAGRTLSDAEVLDALAENPRLLQRPIAEAGDRARIGRPPERVLELLP